MPLLSFMWADHQLNDISWLRADTFSWQSGAVYTAVYQHLVDDIDGITAESETVGGITISFYRAPDGHKITTDESAVLSIYNATGVAWYYVLDTVNTRFKLPRTKFGFTGLRNGVGGYVDAGLPNITGSVNLTGSGVTTTTLFNANDVADSALYNNVSITAGRYHNDSNTGSGYNRIEIDASRSSSIYKDGATVQPKATEMYLYFYVGQFTQTAIEQTAGLNTEMFNDLNAHKVIEYQEPTSANNYTWYRKYADGWVEQGGKQVSPVNANNWATTTITLPVVMANTNYNVYVANCNLTNGAYGSGGAVLQADRTTTSFVYSQYNVNGGSDTPLEWEVKGIAA
jgi:hypothetical protein